jgi:CheY-like chemotaxis protein
VQQLVQLNAAAVGFESELGVGSTFWIDMGLVSAAPADTASAPISADRPQLRGERVLLVGAPDDAELVLLGRYLRSLGCEVVVATDEYEARRAIRADLPAVVLITDAFRPSPPGGRLASFVRDEERAGHIPVLLLTRRAFLADVEQFLRQDVDRCLSKPVRLVDLARACQEALELSRRLTSS